jgi:DNA modification methylase
MYFKGMLFWHKTNAVLQFRKIAYRNSVEMMLWASKQAITKNNSNFIFHKQEEMTNIFHAPVVMGKERTAHPTQKSLYVCKKIIERHCRKGGIVLDPFSGSGSISVAAYSLGRNFIGIEKDQKWNEIAKQRIKEYQIKVEEHTDKFEQIKF